ncbi:hypothetical protein ABW19_dt0202926 [Dactylella cylindrospora]|nr:hypothetical protein ABW19_dt0202926 [Dactylella cylindrospora]
MVTETEIAQAVLQAVDGLFPESDEISSAELSSGNLPAILSLLQETVDGIKSEIRHIGESQQDEVTAWTQEARQLHSELSYDHNSLAEITQYESQGAKLDDRVRDLSSQRILLGNEIIFNEELVALLSDLKNLQDIVTEAEGFASEGSLDKACGRFEDASHALGRLSGTDQVLAVGLIKENIRSLRERLVETVEDSWAKLIAANSAERCIVIHQTVPRTLLFGPSQT